MARRILQVAVVLASRPTARVGPLVAGWFLDRAAQRPELKLDPVEIADDDGAAFRDAIAAADAVVIITPEYNHAYPGTLKSAIDGLRQEWFAKPVGFVTYGGISGGLRAAEQLRLVLAELHTVTIRETVSFAHGERAFGPDGHPRDRGGTEKAVTRFLDVLSWWAYALIEARAREPFPG